MKGQLCSGIFLLISTLCYAQITFESGYFIDNDGDSTKCFIKNVDWESNPTSIDYRLTEDAQKQNTTIEAIQEFGIDNTSKYIRRTVEIDRSSELLSILSTKRQPEFKEETLFLKVLVEGDATLLEYGDGSLRRYFFQLDQGEIKQLVYKSYKTQDGRVGKNTLYKQQLKSGLNCPEMNLKKFDYIDYTRTDLSKAFAAFNVCVDKEFINFTTKPKRDKFKLNLRPGLNIASVKSNNVVSGAGRFEINHQLGYRIGVEVEGFMPFNKNKWAIIVEPTFQYFKASQELNFNAVTVEYKSIELPFGLRHYLFFNEHSKVFFNAMAFFDFGLGSSIDYEFGSDLEIRTTTNYAVGVGYKQSDLISLEFRYHSGRNLLRNLSSWDTKFRNISIILGYSLIRSKNN